MRMIAPSGNTNRASVIRIPESPSGTLRIIGVNSGTSCDGLDFALVEFQKKNPPRVIMTKTYSYQPKTRELLLTAGEPEYTNGEGWMELDAGLGKIIGKKAAAFMALSNKCKIKPDLIASHGHTVRHLPGGKFRSITMQIGDPAQIASHAGIPVVFDFRKSDTALS